MVHTQQFRDGGSHRAGLGKRVDAGRLCAVLHANSWRKDSTTAGPAPISWDFRQSWRSEPAWWPTMHAVVYRANVARLQPGAALYTFSRRRETRDASSGIASYGGRRIA